MTKKLKLKAKVFGDKNLYEVTEFDLGNSVTLYDKKTGCHMDFDWNLIEGFISENPKLIAQMEVKNIVRKPCVSGSVCDHPPRNRHYYNDTMYKCYKCGKTVKQTDR